MKKFILVLACLILIICPVAGTTFCIDSKDEIEFVYGGRVFEYNYEKNIKHSDVFDVKYQLNKYKRFGTKEERINLLKQMLSLGFDKEVAVNYLFPNLNKKILEIEKNVNVRPQSAKLITNTNTEKVFTIQKEVVGIVLDKMNLYSQICENLLLNKKLVFKVPIIKTIPEHTAEEYKKYTNLRSDFSTDISSSSLDRKHNVKNALNSLNKIEIAPGQTFSFNKIVGRRTQENGYRTAKIIVNNEFVDGVGGGVCQVSTTLYNAALLAGLNVVEANKHSKQIGYVKYGFDAMVNYGSSDLRFVNNTNQKIIIITNYSKTKARIRIFGENLENVTYKLKNEIQNVVEPNVEIVVDDKGKYADKVVYEDESFYLQKANKGMDIITYREKYVEGKKVEEQKLRHDKYKVQDAIKVIGAKKREPMILDFLNLAS